MSDERFQKVQQELQRAAVLVGDAVTHLAGTAQEIEALRLGLRFGQNPTDVLCDAISTEHRRQHRPGPTPRIASDPELEAFIRARIDHMTYEALAREVALHFSEERRVAKSAIQAWWAQQRPGQG